MVIWTKNVRLQRTETIKAESCARRCEKTLVSRETNVCIGTSVSRETNIFRDAQVLTKNRLTIADMIDILKYRYESIRM